LEEEDVVRRVTVGICIFPLLSSNAGGYNSHSSANKQTFRYLIS